MLYSWLVENDKNERGMSREPTFIILRISGFSCKFSENSRFPVGVSILLPKLLDESFGIRVVNNGGSQQLNWQRGVASAHRLQRQALKLTRQRQTSAGSAGKLQKLVHFL